MRKPEMTKKTSTPMKPPVSRVGQEVVDDDQADRERAEGLDVGANFASLRRVVCHRAPLFTMARGVGR